MQVRRFQVDPLLVPYIDAIWTFQTETALSPNDIRTFPPNAKPKLLLPIRGTISCHINHRDGEHAEARIMVIGAMEGPVVLNCGPNTTLGVEFRPGMAYPFLGVSMKDLLNAAYSWSTIVGRMGQEVEWQIEDNPVIEEKVSLIQRFLIQRLYALSNEDRLIETAVSMIQSTRGLMSVTSLSQALGYSKQYVERKFREQVGLSPKTLSRILRFQAVYHRWMAQPTSKVSWQEYANLYYDQAHFIKEFKHFTGFSPLEYTQQVNEFMQTFYQP